MIILNGLQVLNRLAAVRFVHLDKESVHVQIFGDTTPEGGVDFTFSRVDHPALFDSGLFETSRSSGALRVPRWVSDVEAEALPFDFEGMERRMSSRPLHQADAHEEEDRDECREYEAQVRLAMIEGLRRAGEDLAADHFEDIAGGVLADGRRGPSPSRIRGGLFDGWSSASSGQQHHLILR